MVAPTPDATPTGRCTTPVAKWSELVDRQPAAARVAETDLVVVRKDAEVVVLFGRCTHRGGLMAEGRVEEDTLVCAFHGWDYTLSTGVSAIDPCERLHRFSAAVDHDSDVVLVDEAEIRAWKVANPPVFEDDELML